jgi:uncharacterized membrane protein YfcA
MSGMRVNRFVLAMIAFVVLGLLTWSTITDEKLRLATFAVLALFAVRTILRRKDVMHPDGSSDGNNEPM